MTDSLRTALSAQEVALLSRLGGSVAESLDRPIASLTFNDFNDLRDKVSDVLIRDGFEDEQGETVNDLGRRCETLIDRLAPWHWGKEEPNASA